MIARLYGKLLRVHETVVLIDVAGVGYEVEVTTSVLASLPAHGQPFELCTHLIVREDASHLFGFVDHDERELFRTLIKVAGVGPRMAMGLLSGMDAAELARCVMDNDTARLTKLPGIGRKTAERLVLELKDRIAHLTRALPPARAAAPSRAGQVVAEAEQALIALGYRPAEATRAVGAVFRDGITTEALLREALRSLAPSVVSEG
jgi:holliday junction DNA helicase RuvA